MRVFRTLSVALVLLALVSGQAFADVPHTMNVQGRLTDSNGDPIVGNATLIFKIYATPTDPREIWPQKGATDESHVVSLDANGLWTAEIGTIYPITTSVYSDSSRWLEVQHLETGTVFPRIHMSSGACEILGLDPMMVACEGRFVAVVPAADVRRTIDTINRSQSGIAAAQIGHVADERSRLVVCRTPLGTRRIIDLPAGEQLPRIC
ncbi:MAG: hypothetical protein Kow0074_03760 [Candidatus Zixiibacteriota bacterium]